MDPLMHWYTSDEMNLLLKHYISENQEVELLTAMLGTNWRDSNDLKENLFNLIKTASRR